MLDGKSAQMVAFVALELRLVVICGSGFRAQILLDRACGVLRSILSSVARVILDI